MGKKRSREGTQYRKDSRYLAEAPGLSQPARFKSWLHHLILCDLGKEMGVNNYISIKSLNPHKVPAT